jgi:hypothetical protein
VVEGAALLGDDAPEERDRAPAIITAGARHLEDSRSSVPDDPLAAHRDRRVQRSTAWRYEAANRNPSECRGSFRCKSFGRSGRRMRMSTYRKSAEAVARLTPEQYHEYVRSEAFEKAKEFY